MMAWMLKVRNELDEMKGDFVFFILNTSSISFLSFLLSSSTMFSLFCLFRPEFLSILLFIYFFVFQYLYSLEIFVSAYIFPERICSNVFQSRLETFRTMNKKKGFDFHDVFFCRSLCAELLNERTLTRWTNWQTKKCLLLSKNLLKK